MTGLSLLTRGYVEPLSRIVAQVPLSPIEGQQILVKSLETPLSPSVTEALGIFQTDIILRTAIVAAIADIRSKPWLVDYIFASLPRDSMTMADYGEQEVAAAKKWFLSTNIPVFMSYRIDETKIPCITIGLVESSEAENTLADIHYQSTEATETTWPILAGPFTPVQYDIASGTIILPASVTVSLYPGIILFDSIGRQYEVLDVLGDDTIVIKSGVVADFGKAILKDKPPVSITTLESLSFKETYSIGCHVNSEPFYLTYLHSIVCFILLRYKQALLEARGIERTTISSSAFNRNEQFENELVYSRFINLTGYVRHYWPKAFQNPIGSITSEPSIQINKVNAPEGVEADNSDKDSLWRPQKED